MSVLMNFRKSLKKGDLVEVLSGREKGKTGKISNINKKTYFLTIDKLNLRKKHLKPNQKNQQGGIIEISAPLHSSKVMLVCPQCNQGVRIRMVQEQNEKFRACKKCGSKI